MANKPAAPNGPTHDRRRASRKPKSLGAMANDAGAPVPSSEPSYDQIAEAAYQRYLQRGGSHGDDLNDWIEAERELKQQPR